MRHSVRRTRASLTSTRTTAVGLPRRATAGAASAVRRLLLISALLVAALGVSTAAPIAAAPAAAAAKEVTLRVLSTRADLLSGGDALIEVLIPAGVRPSRVALDLNGSDVTSAFAVRRDGRFYGRVDGMQLGANVLSATLPGGRGARITLTNHPIGGPLFAGPQVQPWICETEQAGLGPALDDQCNVPTQTRYVYMSSDPSKPGFQPYDPQNPPNDIATTTTDDGQEVPFIVRREKGVINRGIYEIVVLADPSKPWEPWEPQRTWNRKLSWTFIGGCSPDHTQNQTGTQGGVDSESVVARGFMVAHSTLTVLGQNCNAVVAAEAVTMIKEHIVERYGEIRYTIGDGCSGGSMLQHDIAGNYPGLIDGLRTACSFADIWALAAVDAFDCSLLMNYFNTKSPHLWAAEPQRSAVTGYQANSICLETEAVFTDIWWDPEVGCIGDGAIIYGSGDFAYDNETNPNGVRCTIHDYMVAITGRRSDGFANRPLDNVGVQYGLKGLQEGKILPEQFVDLNEKVGGWDIDAQFQRERSSADIAALEHLYRSGRITHGGSLESVPIIDRRSSTNSDVHSNLHPRITEARLIRSNGHANNRAAWTEPDEWDGSSSSPETTALSFNVMDNWLAAIEADSTSDPAEVKVLRNKPPEAADGCFRDGQRVDDTFCSSYTAYSDPRLVAGMPMTRDILKCQLKALNRDDYEVAFSESQWKRLEAAFPGGVCDFTKPGVAQQPPIGAWLSFADGPGGHPLGATPTSTPLAPGAGDGAPEPAQTALPATGSAAAAVLSPFAAALLLAAGAMRRGRGDKSRP